MLFLAHAINHNFMDTKDIAKNFFTMNRKEAIEIVKKNWPNNDFTQLREALETLIPELRVNEDEGIMTRLIALVEAFGQGKYKDEMLAYLERQKEQKPIELPKSEDYGIDGLYAALDILQKTLGEVEGYQTDDGFLEHKCAISAVKELYEQQPAESDVIKGGDFISDGKRVFLVLANVKERNLGETGSTFCEGHILGVDGVVYCNGDNFIKFKRATSNERAKFIHDLKVGVELKEQPAEWSKEDEIFLGV